VVSSSIFMRAIFSRAGLVLLLSLAPAVSVQAQAPAAAPARVPVYVFSGDGCPHCAAQKPFLDELAARYAQVEVHSFEVWYQPENRPLFQRMAARAGFEAGGVPATFIGGRVWVGFHESMKREMEAAVITCLRSPCIDPGSGIVPGAAPAPAITPRAPPAAPPRSILELPEPPPEQPGQLEQPIGAPDPAPVQPQAEPPPAAAPVDEPVLVTLPVGEPADAGTITLPVIGTIGLGAHSLPFSTAMIAFVDGFNPCSLWVLSILLALVLHTGSRRKIALVGSTFLLVTAAVYGLFIAGLFKVFTVIEFLGPVQAVVALLALAFALVNIKDYFWYGRGVSFTIADRHKPKIYRDIRGLLSPGRSTAALLGATVVMALGIALIELPCTAGFPVLWSNLVASHGVTPLEFSMLLGLYMAVYLLDELVVFGTAVYTLKMSRMEEQHGRLLKLVGGMVMLALALVLLIDPSRMNTFGGSLAVFGAAFGATLLVLLVHRWVGSDHRLAPGRGQAGVGAAETPDGPTIRSQPTPAPLADAPDGALERSRVASAGD
jgi:glutaredoxin